MEKPKEPLKHQDYEYYPPEYNAHSLYSKTFVHPDCVSQYVEHAEEDENYETDETKIDLSSKIKEWWYDTNLFSLQDLLNMSQGLDPKNVIISVHRERSIDHIDVTVEHRSDVDKVAWQIKHDEHEAEYQKQCQEYLEKDKQYQLWAAEQELEKLTNRILKIKNEI